MESISFTNQFDDLSSNWQFINSIKSDSDCDFDSESDGFGSWSLLSDSSLDHESNYDDDVKSTEQQEQQEQQAQQEQQVQLKDLLIETIQQLIEQPPPPVVDDEDSARSKIGGKKMVNWVDYAPSSDGDDYYEEEEEIDVDDELIPRCMSNRIGKERMRKLGKRSFKKMMKTKKVAHTNNRRGCVYGKHDLTLKYSF